MRETGKSRRCVIEARASSWMTGISMPAPISSA